MTFFKTSRLFMFLFGIAFIVSSCDDNDNDDPMYPEPAGFSIQIDGVDFVIYEDGSYTYNPEGVTPEYEYNNRVMLSMVHEGGNLVDTRETRPDSPRYYSPVVQIRFHDAQGNHIPYPEERDSEGEINPDGQYRLEYDWVDPVEDRKANIEQHGGDGSWGFHIRADQPGETGIVFSVYRCEDVADIVSLGFSDDPNDPQRTERECNVAEEQVFEASAPLMIYVDDEYEGIEEGRYPHERHFRIR
ncbi:hypothetical protein [Natronogracilivirga saccharolytica]|uniref:Uncharacterized protein n=1 Tax=Natronogracilivirga saccharolytica TaxID=2812953 RepID=A0A8J7UUB3_9BACT|nr:hypothetical protein [Natronogracilivirga saccharolytica]MBP3192245.1 hypothetical protein [Natronogracilivirga saccharolytica]